MSPVQLALGAPPPGFQELFPVTGEHARASATLARLAGTGRIAREVVAALYAHEFVERTRAQVEAGVRRLAAPFWPALPPGEDWSAWPELERLLPACEVSWSEARPEYLAAESGRLGFGAFEAQDYLQRLRACAAARGWRTRRAAPEAVAGEPERATAAAFLLHEGRLLLERRPASARVTPGVWDIPGGHLEPGETARAAFVREMREELGLSCEGVEEVLALDAREPPDGRHYRHHYFVVRGGSSLEAREGQQLSWYAPRAALALAELAPVTAFALQELYERGALDAPDE